MRERVPCEFFLIRYVPDVVKGEFVNIGVLLREAAGPGGDAPAAAQVRFTRDWRRVRCMDAGADLDLLEALEQEIGARLKAGVSAREPKGVLEVLEDSLSNSVQMTGAKATLAENLTTEMEQLMRMYVDPLKVPRAANASRRSGRALLRDAMQREFAQAGVWSLMRKRIAAATYTQVGDPLKIDCGYCPEPDELKRQTAGGMIRMFQAVSLAGDVEGAKGLAFSAPHLREGVRRVEALQMELTAVVEPLRFVTEEEDGEEAERYRFGVQTMEEREIRVLTLHDLGRVAETAQRELRLI